MSVIPFRISEIFHEAWNEFTNHVVIERAPDKRQTIKARRVQFRHSDVQLMSQIYRSIKTKHLNNTKLEQL